MSTASLAMTWLQLLALLAAEVGLIAVGVALLLRWSPSAAWRRTFCQAGIAAVLIVTACELSGSARVLGSWAVSALTWGAGSEHAAPLTPLAPLPRGGTARPRPKRPVCRMRDEPSHPGAGVSDLVVASTSPSLRSSPAGSGSGPAGRRPAP